ncbi:hypothetical protein [Xanthomonas phage DES1]|nr:hypothetical protein [Xanthomonas phage DES1]
MSSEEKTITIKLSIYRALQKDREILRALEAGGVDNWEWYSESLRDAGLLDDEEEDDEG